MIAHLGLQRKECGKNRLYHLRIDVSTVKDIMNAIKQQFMSSTNHVFYIRDTVIPVTRAQGSVVPERPTQRCSPRFRPRGRFCALRFRCQSSPTGREGEISRPLDHM